MSIPPGRQPGKLNSWYRLVIARLGTGLLILLPFGITYLVLKFAFDFVDGIFQPVITWIFGSERWGLGFVIVIALALVVGTWAETMAHRRGVPFLDWTLRRIPVVGFIYGTAKQLVDAFDASGPGFKRVVAIEYPKEGVWSLGFFTSTIMNENGEHLGSIYIPSVPTPNTGFVVLVPLDRIYDVDLPVEYAMRLVLSGGVAAPTAIKWSRVLDRKDGSAIQLPRPTLVTSDGVAGAGDPTPGPLDDVEQEQGAPV